MKTLVAAVESRKIQRDVARKTQRKRRSVSDRLKFLKEDLRACSFEACFPTF